MSPQRLPYIIESNYLGTIYIGISRERERSAAAGSTLTVLKYKLGSRLPVRYTHASSLPTISADRYSERSSSFYYINRLADNTLLKMYEEIENTVAF